MSTLDTLELCFSANLNGVDAQLNALCGQLGTVSDAALECGRTLSSRFGAGILSGMPTAAAAARTVAESAKLDGALAQARSAGAALSAGFASGIRSGSGAMNAAVSAMVQSATRKIRSLLSIHSPSKVTEGFGAYFGEGFARGILGSADEVGRAAGRLSETALNGLSAQSLPFEGAAGDAEGIARAAVERALEGVSVTIPISVDGMKLGEASIRGINAVTRSAGRLLLNI